MEKPFFTVITVCYNAGDGLCAAIDALRRQTCQDYQHIIKDGGSTDGSVDAIRPIIDGDEKTLFIACPDGGIYDAMNQALAEAQGKYIYFLNCGDAFYDESVLSDVKQFILNDTVNLPKTGQYTFEGGAVIYGDMMLRGAKIRQPKRVDKFYLFRRPLNHQSMFFSREIFKRFGDFDTAFSIRADHELTVRAYRMGVPFLRIDRIINVYEGGGFSERPDKADLRREELLLIRKRHFTDEERKRFEKRLQCTLSRAASPFRSPDAPEWVRRVYRGVANFFNR